MPEPKSLPEEIIAKIAEMIAPYLGTGLARQAAENITKMRDENTEMLKAVDGAPPGSPSGIPPGLKPKTYTLE
jgi:hypothetical protein